MSEEPSPCPFCNGMSYPVGPSLGRSHWNVFCDDCGAYGPHGHDDEQAIRQWNIRAVVATSAPLELLKAAMWAADNYENININHVDYRVEVKRRMDDAIAKVRGQ